MTERFTFRGFAPPVPRSFMARATGGSPAPAPTPTPSSFVVALTGQSEIVYITNPTSPYNLVAQPSNVPSGNLLVYTQTANGAPVVTTAVTQAAATARAVNPAMSAMACALNFVLPGRVFHIAAGCVSGTGRVDLADDSTDGTDGRLWADYEAVVTAAETNAGRATDLVLEAWYRSDSPNTPNFVNAFWPFYFGSTAAGDNFTLGTVNAVTTRRVDHCLWDAQAAPASKGRGLFSRAATKWSVLTPLSDIFAYPVAPSGEANNFTAFTGAMSEPRRQVITDLAANALAQSVDVTVGPAPIITQFDVPGGSNGGPTHPTTANADGQIGFMWPFFVALCREAGMTIGEPFIESFEAASDGAWCDAIVRLPNGGNLTTLRLLESRAAISSAVPHRQQVIGFEMGRSGAYRPVFNAAETSYPAATRGTVTITDTGSGTPRRGRVRITPTVPFSFGDAVRYLAGGASAVLQTPRDIGVHADMLLETIPGMRDGSATYPFPGVAVRPLQSDTLVPVPPPAFTAAAAYFDAAGAGVGDYFLSSSISQIAGQNGLFSAWIRLDDTSWNAITRNVFEYRVGSTAVYALSTTSSGRMTLRLNNNTAADTFAFLATPGGAQFVTGQWYHVMFAWRTTGALAGSDLTIWVNGQQVRTGTFCDTLDMAGATITRFALGSTTGPVNLWRGDIGEFWSEVNLASAYDLSAQANRERFVLAGRPVDLGPAGALPTGTAPKWYYRGLGAAMNNVASPVPPSAGTIPLIGALTNPTLAPTVPQF